MICPSNETADGRIKHFVEFFKLLSDGTRLRVMLLLSQHKELNVQTLCELLGQSQPAVSHHLALLRVAGMVEVRRDGKHNFYRFARDEFHDLADEFRAAFQLSDDASDYVDVPRNIESTAVAQFESITTA